MLKKIKFEYVIAIFFAFLTLTSVLSRNVIIQKLDQNYKVTLREFENHFQELFLTEHLKNLSHRLNIDTVNYFLTGDSKIFKEMQISRKNFNDTINSLKKTDLEYGKDDSHSLEEILRYQNEKMAFFDSRANLNFDDRVAALLSPELQRKNESLRESMGNLLQLEKKRYDSAKNEVLNYRVQAINNLLFFSLVVFILSLLLVWLIMVYAKRSRLAHQKSIAAVRSRDEIIAVVSHDLKSPLTSISLNSQILIRKLLRESGLDGSYLKKIQSIQRAVSMMLDLIQNLLDHAKLQSGKLNLDSRSENLEKIVTDSESLISPLAQTKSIEITNDLSKDLPPVKCDKGKTMQIITNLLSNAVKFVGIGGKIKVEAHQENDQVRISIVDDGPGISEADLPFVFDRYWQPKKTNKQGSGLGLAIVKGLVQAQGGSVGVESQLNKGTTFYFTLPLAN